MKYSRVHLAIIGALFAGVYGTDASHADPKPVSADLLWAEVEAASHLEKAVGRETRTETVRDIWVVAAPRDSALTDRGIRTLTGVHRALDAEFLDTAPATPVAIYLFDDPDEYERFAESFSGQEAGTPYGFYLPSRRAIIMNLATGTGTLAHELVHPLIEADFPQAPAWFDEGFASLFEQSGYDDDGRLRGLVNWRLEGLQDRLSQDESAILREVMTTTRAEFYADESGDYYAAARYLCLYLQEQGRLTDYYSKMRSAAGAEPIALLEELLGQELSELEPDWARWVAELEY